MKRRDRLEQCGPDLANMVRGDEQIAHRCHQSIGFQPLAERGNSRRWHARARGQIPTRNPVTLGLLDEHACGGGGIVEPCES